MTIQQIIDTLNGKALDKALHSMSMDQLRAMRDALAIDRDKQVMQALNRSIAIQKARIKVLVVTTNKRA